jgi:hypothetical protein
MAPNTALNASADKNMSFFREISHDRAKNCFFAMAAECGSAFNAIPYGRETSSQQTDS